MLSRCTLLLTTAFLAFSSGPTRADHEYSIRLLLPRPGQPAVIEVQGLDARNQEALKRSNWSNEKWQALLSVKVGTGSAAQIAARPCLLGTYRIHNDRLQFTPRFPFEPGLPYHASLDPARLPIPTNDPPRTQRVALPPPPPRPQAFVERIYPTRNQLPENQLKFYIHFSAPMAQGRVYRYIQLLDAKGKAIAWPFLELDEELWNPDGTRFTLFIDPGRIKRGLKPREDLGPALEEGKKYTLVIDARWNDAEGRPLRETYRKTFTVVAPDEACPSLEKWQITAPPGGTRRALEVTFPEPLDSALLQRLVWVVDPRGEKVPGTIALEREETVWRFTPEKAWTAGEYRLLVDTRLEDLAGNSLAKPFEVDVLRKIERTIKQETVARSFRVTGTSGR